MASSGVITSRNGIFIFSLVPSSRSFRPHVPMEFAKVRIIYRPITMIDPLCALHLRPTHSLSPTLPSDYPSLQPSSSPTLCLSQPLRWTTGIPPPLSPSPSPDHHSSSNPAGRILSLLPLSPSPDHHSSSNPASRILSLLLVIHPPLAPPLCSFSESLLSACPSPLPCGSAHAAEEHTLATSQIGCSSYSLLDRSLPIT